MGIAVNSDELRGCGGLSECDSNSLIIDVRVVLNDNICITDLGMTQRNQYIGDSPLLCFRLGLSVEVNRRDSISVIENLDIFQGSSSS